MKVDSFDKRLIKAPQLSFDECAVYIDSFKRDVFGFYAFTESTQYNLRHDIFTIDRDGSKLVYQIKLP